MTRIHIISRGERGLFQGSLNFASETGWLADDQENADLCVTEVEAGEIRWVRAETETEVIPKFS